MGPNHARQHDTDMAQAGPYGIVGARFETDVLKYFASDTRKYLSGSAGGSMLKGFESSICATSDLYASSN